MSSANPIMRRLAELQAQWSRFAEDDSAILLRWVITDPYDWPLVRAFFDVEASEASVFPDLFVKLESPFESRTNHGRTLALELATRYQQMRPALAEAEVNTDWRAPARSRAGPTWRDFTRWRRACTRTTSPSFAVWRWCWRPRRWRAPLPGRHGSPQPAGTPPRPPRPGPAPSSFAPGARPRRRGRGRGPGGAG